MSGWLSRALEAARDLDYEQPEYIYEAVIKTSGKTSLELADAPDEDD